MRDHGRVRRIEDDGEADFNITTGNKTERTMSDENLELEPSHRRWGIASMARAAARWARLS
jgi:hypothetical protein